MSDNTEALRLADALEREYSGCHEDENDFLEMDAAAELRRLVQQAEADATLMRQALTALEYLSDYEMNGLQREAIAALRKRLEASNG